MTPIKIVFQSSESLTVYSEDPASFSDSVLAAKPPEIRQLEYIELSDEATPELAEVKLTLQSGATVLCHLAKSDMPKASFIKEISDCETNNSIAYSKLALQEADLDKRLLAAGQFINNMPDLDVRLALHKAYLKRKQSYAAAIESLVDGVIRRPEQ